ncbi:MAG: carbohydrate binding family 9 domain-containing protein, partial [Gemmatimonadota bacterium]|nr:carbohydrate binding family 9 domain-containing protein [Gemmatimonadota bacterium]
MAPNGRTQLAALIMLVCATGARAQTRANVHPEPPPVVHAARRTAPITIDGRLHEPAWSSATAITDFHQSFPREGAQPSERTELRVLFDDAALYVGARMHDSRGPTGVRAKLARRDQLLDSEGLTSDKIAIVLDPYHNHNDRFWFEVNPYGVRGEHANGDASFDPIWEAAAHVDSLGWTAEMRIPYSQLRFSRDTAQTWGMQVWRTIDRLNEQDMWAFWRANESGGPPRFGHLTGLSILHRPRQLELLPYAVSRAQFKYADPADPFHRKREQTQRFGADARYLLTSNLTLDATVNPDFGQVEVDPAVVNLSAFETFFEEKRPFFVANRGAFSFGSFNCFFCNNTSNLGLFYSRRIGREPQLNGDVAGNAQFADLPENTRILGAVKVTGRTAQGFSVGLLDAVT